MFQPIWLSWPLPGTCSVYTLMITEPQLMPVHGRDQSPGCPEIRLKNGYFLFPTHRTYTCNSLTIWNRRNGLLSNNNKNHSSLWWYTLLWKYRANNKNNSKTMVGYVLNKLISVVLVTEIYEKQMSSISNRRCNQ
jgi:hypothetical protein